MQRFLVAAIFAAGCSTTHGIRPIGKGSVGVDASIGGPITQVFGAPIPLPLSTIGATVGVTDTTDVHAAFHPTAAAMFAVAAFDLGASQQLLAPSGARPRLMADLTLLGAGGDLDPDQRPEGGFRFFFQPSVLASWDYGKVGQHSFYTGVTGFFEAAEAFHGLGGFIIGSRLGVGRSHVDIEMKWLNPWDNNTNIVPEFSAPGNQGAVTVQIGYGFRFGGKDGAK